MFRKDTIINKYGEEEEIYRKYSNEYQTYFNEEADKQLNKLLHESEARCKLIKYSFESRHFVSINNNNLREIEISIKRKDNSEVVFFVYLGQITRFVCRFDYHYYIITNFSSVELLDSTIDMFFECFHQLKKAIKNKISEAFPGKDVKAFVVKEEIERSSNVIFELDEINGQLITYNKKCKFIIDKVNESSFDLKFNKEKNEFFIDSIGPIVARDKNSREFLYVI